MTEQEEYKNKQEEYENNMAVQMEVLEEVLDFIVEAFDNQFTSIELQKDYQMVKKVLKRLDS